MRISNLSITAALGLVLSLATMNASAAPGEKAEKATSCHGSTVCVDSDHGPEGQGASRGSEANAGGSGGGSGAGSGNDGKTKEPGAGNSGPQDPSEPAGTH